MPAGMHISFMYFYITLENKANRRNSLFQVIVELKLFLIKSVMRSWEVIIWDSFVFIKWRKYSYNRYELSPDMSAFSNELNSKSYFYHLRAYFSLMYLGYHLWKRNLLSKKEDNKLFIKFLLWKIDKYALKWNKKIWKES